MVSVTGADRPGRHDPTGVVHQVDTGCRGLVGAATWLSVAHPAPFTEPSTGATRSRPARSAPVGGGEPRQDEEHELDAAVTVRLGSEVAHRLEGADRRLLAPAHHAGHQPEQVDPDADASRPRPRLHPARRHALAQHFAIHVDRLTSGAVPGVGRGALRDPPRPTRSRSAESSSTVFSASTQASTSWGGASRPALPTTSSETVPADAITGTPGTSPRAAAARTPPGCWGSRTRRAPA